MSITIEDARKAVFILQQYFQQGQTEVTLLDPDTPITDNQRRCIFAIAHKQGREVPKELSEWTKGQASGWIKEHGWQRRLG